MKKLFLLSILFIFLLSGCDIYNLNYFTLPDDAEFLALVQELDTPQKICDYMSDNFTYKLHTFYALDPYILWQNKEGDCNDFATFGIFIADYHNYETYLIKVFNETSLRHYIAVYKEYDYYSITDNQYYFLGFNNFKEIVNFDSEYMIPNRKWSKYIVYDYDMDIFETVYNN